MNWRSVKDELPTPGKEVLIYHLHGQRQVGEFDINRKWSVYYKGHLVEQGGITHWMPLPERPKEG
ncbi:DUF551 domain-containing protein [Desertivirga xinjiangensis]|uniref:DUF551 domain-containing protein n=1 Tax=Desertivirga xinjiangensis TaxID=539206 RepID=UPI002108BFF8|nr:DUF551 domain-containing protein [Pedobacter xinjiangensis]